MPEVSLVTNVKEWIANESHQEYKVHKGSNSQILSGLIMDMYK